MNYVIIEDEQHARERMIKMMTEIIPISQSIAQHDSVQTAWKWFLQNPFPDLVLLDIQLADGTAFDLLKLIKIDCPVIFTTAYDTYAIDAFKANSIDYLLKPVKKQDLEKALEKLKDLHHIFRHGDIAAPAKTDAADYKKRFVIRFGEHIKTVPVDEVAYFCSENKATFVKTFNGNKFPMDYNLDALEQMINPTMFFRINRQYLINLKAIEEMKIYSKARVIVKLNPPVAEAPIVSSERAAEFKLWLGGE